MILHEEKNYLFVHIQKTGGTSISDCLTRHCGARFLSPSHLQLRCLSFSGPRPFIFTVVRNPWERLVSWYEMLLVKGIHNDFSRYILNPENLHGTVSFPEFLRRTEVIQEKAVPEARWFGASGLVHDEAKGYQKSLAFNQVDYLTDRKGDMICDRILNFDALSREFSDLVAELHPGFKPPELLQLNKRQAPRDWRSYYTSDEDREWVARLYHKDIEYFGFRFDG